MSSNQENYRAFIIFIKLLDPYCSCIWRSTGKNTDLEVRKAGFFLDQVHLSLGLSFLMYKVGTCSTEEVKDVIV